ncbi:MAG: TIGR03663 family protein [Chloroflexota bacterium]
MAIALVGLVLRFYDVGHRALHHDESLHAVYSWYLYIGRGYVHDPLMHGPYQFHMSALLYFLFGASDVTARLSAILHGTGIVLLPYFLRYELGKRGAIAASVLFAISPSFLYFSRFMREDIYLAFYTLGMVVGIFGWMRTRKVGYLWFGSFSLICAFADKEATYIHGFVFTTFFGFLFALNLLDRFLPSRATTAKSEQSPNGARTGTGMRTSLVEPVMPQWAEVWDALAAIPRRTWIECIGIVVVMYVLLFTTFFTNLGDPWNCLMGKNCSMGGLYSGSIGALKYWIDQHDVQRGGQPLYYYVLQLGLYEFLPVIFSVAAATTAWFRRSVFAWFLAWWFFGNFVIYSWAGEKMPWLVPHIAMPLVLLSARWIGDWTERVSQDSLFSKRALLAAGLGFAVCTTVVAFLAVGAAQALSAVQTQPMQMERYTLIGITMAAIAGLVYLATVKHVRVGVPLVAVSLLVLGAFYIRTSWMVVYEHGDIPVEMLVYVQSSPDVVWVTHEIERIGYQTGQRDDLRILMDNGYAEDVGGQRIVHEAVSWPFEWYLRDYKNRRYYSKTFGPDINLKDYPVILVMGPNLDPIRDQLGDYVGQKYKLNWWFPEDYKAWATNPGSILTTLADPVGRAKFLKFLLYREPMNALGAREFYMFVRRDVQTLGPASTTTPLPPAQARPAPAAAPAAPRNTVAEQLDANTRLFGVTQSSEPQLLEPKGVAIGPDGRIYTTEGRANRVTVFNQDGTVAATWGRSGPGDGEFNEPWGIAVAPSGEVYVADTWNHRIEKFTADGKFLTAWGSMADTSKDLQGAPGKFWGPRSIAIGRDGLLYVSDTGNKRIQVFDANGTFVRAMGGAGSEPGKFNEPVGLAFDGDTLVVADAWNGRIQKLDKDGNPLSSVPIQGWESHGIANKPYIAAGADGSLYVTMPERGEVQRISPNGQISPVVQPVDRANRIGMPTGIAVGPEGAVYTAQSGGGSILVQQVGGAP